jgi:hypothetical protein
MVNRLGAYLWHSVPPVCVPKADVGAGAQGVLNVGVDFRGSAVGWKMQVRAALKEVPLTRVVEIRSAGVSARGVEPGEIDERLTRMPSGLVPLAPEQGQSRATAIDTHEVAIVL